MSLEAGRILVRLATVGALVRPHVAVGQDVGVQVARVTEGLVTVWALVRGGGAVGRLVFLVRGKLY